MTVLNCEKMGCQIDTVPDSVYLLNISFNLALIKTQSGAQRVKTLRVRFFDKFSNMTAFRNMLTVSVKFSKIKFR